MSISRTVVRHDGSTRSLTGVGRHQHSEQWEAAQEDGGEGEGEGRSIMLVFGHADLIDIPLKKK